MSSPSPEVQNAVNAAAEAMNGGSHSGAFVSAAPKTEAEKNDDLMTGVATVAVIGVGVALIEVSLIPGMLIGLAAAFAPKFMPKLSENIRPMMRSTVRNAFVFGQKTREMMSEASEHVQDLVAEARAETQQAAAAPSATPANGDSHSAAASNSQA